MNIEFKAKLEKMLYDYMFNNILTVELAEKLNNTNSYKELDGLLTEDVPKEVIHSILLLMENYAPCGIIHSCGECNECSTFCDVCGHRYLDDEPCELH